METLATFWYDMDKFEYKNGVTPLSHWRYPIGASVIYIICKFAGERIMKNRKPIKLPVLTFVHNIFLCLISAAMLLGTIVEAVRIVYEENQSKGITPVVALLCDPSARTSFGRMNAWVYVFYLTKYYEFLDTMFLILMKKEVILLHWYHHFITLILVWVGLEYQQPLQWVPLVTNCGVHVLMYYYYAITSPLIQGRVWWKSYITTIQIIQFVVDLILAQVFAFFLLTRKDCSGGDIPSMIFGEAVILSFLILFIQFYKKTYNNNKGGAGNKKAAKKTE
eukprot:GEZU01035919.1.p1 GENE.GEZU01035919.1~~GEZU01035919.1.p1  ORF type:complete len:278 (-),score=116.67 GEZU01035919.1:77-910(-)